MKRSHRNLLRTLARAGSILALTFSDGWASESEDSFGSTPTLARLSFWVPPQRKREFEAAYREKVVPLLNKHGLTEYTDRGRATPDSFFSRLYEISTPAAVKEKERALQTDPAWTHGLRSLGAAFGTAGPDSLIRYLFTHYSSPAGPGKTVSAGPGAGHWRTHDVIDGLADGIVLSIIQDREGYLWFGTSGGLSRYDGHTFVTFTSRDGLAGNVVRSILQDSDGGLWIGTEGSGASRYDGHRWTTFATKDGLGGNGVRSIFQDREGYLWFSTDNGASRYDGQAFTILTTKDGLVSNQVWSINQDRTGNLWFAANGGLSSYDGRKFVTFTTKDGLVGDWVQSILEDREGNLWFGGWGGLSKYDGRKFVTYTMKDGLAYNRVWSITKDFEGNLWFGTGGGVSRYDGKGFTTFTVKEGLAYNRVWPTFQDREGNLWFGTYGGGASQYDGNTFTTFTTKDGLGHNVVEPVVQDRDGNLWFGTYGGGVSRYDGKSFVTITARDGLPEDIVMSILQDRDGHLWFGTDGGGLSLYDGKTFTTFTAADGLADNTVTSICQDKEGHLWFGSWDHGLSRYDGQRFATLTTRDGLGNNGVRSILRDRNGSLWVGTYGGGASRVDGKTITTFTTANGLPNNNVVSIFQDRDGDLWFGTAGGGVTRYDGKAFTTLTSSDGLPHDFVDSIIQDRKGNLWFGTWGGACQYDGQVFQDLNVRDGLGHSQVRSMFQDGDGNLWFATTEGVTRYHPPKPLPPSVFVDAVAADRRHEKVSDLAVPSSVGLTVFEFHGMSFKTRSEAMIYRYRLKGYDKDWKTTHARRVEYQNLPWGNYTFEVKAIDRDLVYSEKPATVRLVIHPPYGTISLAGGLVLALAGVGVASGYAIRKRRDLRRAEQALMGEMEKELQTAHEMQMGLMPKESPKVEGFDISGRCIPANHVGGDIFQYFRLPQNRLALAMVDVTGHGMEAAIPVAMFSGILKSHMEVGGSLSERLQRLNLAMHGTLTGRTVVCLAMGELDLAGRVLFLSNSGCPYPYHFRSATGEVVEQQVDAYPLGVRLDTEYPVIQVQLGAGDRVIFCSDGIAEATNGSGEQFGYERAGEVIRGACLDGLSAEATIDRILSNVNAFQGDAPQADDMTCVVVWVEDGSACAA